MASIRATTGYFDLNDSFDANQIPMEFEWLDEDGNYTKDDPAFPPLVIPASSLVAGNGSTFTIASSSWVMADEVKSPLAERLDEVVDVLKKIQDRLLVIEERDDEYFEEKAALKKAYDKFRMLEALYGKKKDE